MRSPSAFNAMEATMSIKHFKQEYCKGVCDHLTLCAACGHGTRLVTDGKHSVRVCVPVFNAYIGELWDDRGVYGEPPLVRAPHLATYRRA